MVNGYQFPILNGNDTALHQLATKKFVRYSMSEDVAKLVRTVLSFAKCSDDPYLQLQYNAKLRDAADALFSTAIETNESHFTIIAWLKDISASESCSAICRAWSYYLLGSMSLKSAIKNGGTLGRWNCSSATALLSNAHVYFTDGLQLLGTSCDLLMRNMLRCLAVTIASVDMNDSDALHCFSLINASVGGYNTIQILKPLQQNDVAFQLKSKGNDYFMKIGDSPQVKNVSSRTSVPFLKELGEMVPAEWRFITAAISSTGELLLSSLEFSERGEAIYFNAYIGSDALTPEADIFDSIVKPLNEIVARSQQQLAGISVADSDDETTKENATRRWWHIRKKLDCDLQQHLENVERLLLTSNAVQRVLLGRSSNKPHDGTDANDELPCGNLAFRFEEARSEGVMHPNQERRQARNRSVRQTEDQALVRSLFDDEANNIGVKRKDCSHAAHQPYVAQECIFLILDENLVSFPFEGLSCFDGKAVCRIPSLTFAWAKLKEYGLGSHDNLTFDPQQTSYILDPESNLSGTKDRLAPFLDSIQNDYEYQWNNIVGENPPIDFLENSLRVNDGLLLYFGHGGGQQFCGRGKLESMARHGRQVLSSVILMGCGSGRLESVNTKHSKATTKMPIHYEPEGVAMSYLLAGSPCVVGNLWDVTDRDIDRYSMQLLQSIYDDSGGIKSIAQCVADARQVCKMRYIVGCAPVCYGFPIYARVK